MLDEEWRSSRLALLSYYSSNTLQFAGFTLTLAVSVVAEIQLLTLDGYIRLAIGLIPATATAGLFVLLDSIFWNKMTWVVIVNAFPQEQNVNSLSFLHKKYLEKVQKERRWVRTFHPAEHTIMRVLSYSIVVGVLSYFVGTIALNILHMG